eukprot:8330986-Alexandrium_andersonii.AAC.1
MSASLVGSEMCIRDRRGRTAVHYRCSLQHTLKSLDFLSGPSPRRAVHASKRARSGPAPSLSHAQKKPSIFSGSVPL